MKDEEMAKQYATSIWGSIAQDDGYADEWEQSYRDYLAGLKAGRPQWHDLRKDPKDLPKNGVRVLVLLEDKLYEISRISTDNSWICTDYYTGEDTVIAWCEIPTFDKE